MRRLGPHFAVNTLHELGISAEALQTYHASQSYSSAIQDMFSSSNVSYDTAHHFAMLEVASEMGHDLRKVEDYRAALQAIQQAAVDPVVIAAIKQTCTEMGIGQSGDRGITRTVHYAVPRVSLLLSGRTPDEEEFSRWLNTVPLHSYPQQEIL